MGTTEPDTAADLDVSGDPSGSIHAATRVFGDRLPLAQAYADLLVTAGIERGLLGPREVPRIWERHILNCAALTDVLPVDAHAVDVGSGAGLPGLVLAIRRPDLRVTLVESLRRRVDFLADAVARLGLDGTARVVHGRAEDAAVRAAVGRAGWVTARAVAPIDRLARWCWPLLAPHGVLLAVKGSTAEAELDRCRPALRRLGAVEAEVRELGDASLATDLHATVIVVRRGESSS